MLLSTGSIGSSCEASSPRHPLRMDVARLVNGLGGMAQKRQLVARGARDHHLTAAVRNGSVIRARQGWYTTMPAQDRRVRAVRVGGRLTGLSAIAALGGRVLSETVLHVALPRNAARLRSQHDRRVHPPAPRIRGVRLHWQEQAPGSAWSVALVEALGCVIHDESREQAIAVLDWALHTGRVDRLEVERLLVGTRIVWSDLDSECESLPESLARTRLRAAGHSVRSQVRFGGLERIDLVVDDIVGLEVDGEAYHRDSFEEDRAKDGRILSAGYIPYRPSARSVFSDWPTVLAAIEVALSTFGNSGRPPPKRQVWRRKAPTAPRIPEFPDGAGMRAGGAALALP